MTSLLIPCICGSPLIHKFSTRTHDYYECKDCGETVIDERDPYKSETEETNQYLQNHGQNNKI
jgi:hypothetical protein